jgi:uncharacterized membrane protein
MRTFVLIIWSMLFLGVGMVMGAPKALPEGEVEARKVEAIFREKCADCHGAQLARPKGKFGYVLDLKRVAGNTDYVVRGNPEKSEIYSLVFSEEMPGEDSEVPPLTKGEKEDVRRWIELGAPAVVVPVAVEPVVAEVNGMPTWKKLLRLVGRFHPVSTHFPVALMLVAVLAEGLVWWTGRNSWSQTVRFLVVLAAMGAVATVILGWINASFTNYLGENVSILFWHRWVGTLTGVWALVCSVLLLLCDDDLKSLARRRFRGALLLGAGLVSIAGFLGGALVYGLDHYAW